MNVDKARDELLNVRETAKLLGVHENTVRNWVKSGALPDARVPGSNFHKFRLADVERMRSIRTQTATESKEQQQKIGPELVDGTQLSTWASTKSAQSKFPELIRRLLAATPGVQRILIRANEGVAVGGWDGSAVSQGSQYLPAGNLRFEFGVDKEVKRKADAEWDHRKDAKESSSVVFVFATPRRWGNAQAWAQARRAEKKFADVWVIDADVLEGWLAITPAVHYWISEQLGRRPANAQTLEGWWDQFCVKTKPQLPASLFLAGRNEQAKVFQKFISGPAGLLTIRTEWASDAIAFIYASSRATEYKPTLQPVILVDTAEVWNSVINQPSPAVLIPTFENANTAAATSKGHHVVVILDMATASTQSPDLTLPRLERIATGEAFQSIGVGADVAQRYAVHARRNLQAFVRSISVNPAYSQPSWARPPLAKPLASLILIGEWTTQEADLKLIEKVVGKSWNSIEQDLDQVSGTDDPVFRKIGNHWSLTSPGEAFALLASSLKTSDMILWSEVFQTCLLETDPTLNLSNEERPLAAIHGVHRNYSSAIRKGMARSAALMGSRGHVHRFDDNSTLAQYVAQTLGTVFTEALADASGRKWEEIVDVLPLLAEAAPEEFLNALNQDLASPHPGLAHLFQDDTQSSSFALGPSSPHPWLLWAIETIAWSDEFFMDGIRILARLATIDTPESRTSNRPAASLASILCGWAQNTSASLAQKTAALSAVNEINADVCWDLLQALWPGQQSFVIPPATPRIRDWQPGSSTVLMAEWLKYSHTLVDLSIKLARNNPDRIAKLVEGLANVSETDQTKILKFLKSSAAQSSGLNTEQRFKLWEQLHKDIARHERFSSAAWSFSPEIIAQLKLIAAELEPTNDPKRFAYLFDWHPDLPGVDSSDIKAHDALLSKLQSNAIAEIMQAPNPIGNLEALTRQAQVPGHVGWALADKNHDGVKLSNMALWLDSSESSLCDAGITWFNRMVQLNGAPWLERALKEDILAGDARARAIRSIPSQRKLWEVLAQDKKDSDLYWQNARIRAFDLPADDVYYAVEQLSSHDRAWAAIEVLADTIHPPTGETMKRQGFVSTDLILEILNRAIKEDPQPQDISNMTSYYTGMLLDYLAEAKTDASTMARLEFAFFRLLEHNREPRFLNAELAKDPSIFVDLAKRVYRGKNDQKSEPTEREQQLANQAWWVINGWKGFPGRSADGTVNAKILNTWVKSARFQFTESDRSEVGDELIGESFGYSPAGKDGAWPAEPIRDLIETIGSQKLENGIIIGRRNSRGVTSRGPYEGGAQERGLAGQYREWSKAVKTKWPRTARLLRIIADSYDDEARRQDIHAELEGDQD